MGCSRANRLRKTTIIWSRRDLQGRKNQVGTQIKDYSSCCAFIHKSCFLLYNPYIYSAPYFATPSRYLTLNINLTYSRKIWPILRKKRTGLIYILQKQQEIRFSDVFFHSSHFFFEKNHVSRKSLQGWGDGHVWSS